MLPQIATRPSPADADTRARLAADLRTGWEEERADWDAQVTGGAMSGTDLWGSMPTVDSKTVARMAPIFEKHEGRPIRRPTHSSWRLPQHRRRDRASRFWKMTGSSESAERIPQEVES